MNLLAMIPFDYDTIQCIMELVKLLEHKYRSRWRIIAQTCKKLKKKFGIENEFDYTILVLKSIHRETKLSLVIHAINMDN